jgi:hypothetical protein
MKTEIREHAKREAMKLEQRFLDEVNRILNSGMVDDDTAVSGIFRVALDNMAMNYSKSKDHKNLSRI